MSIPVNPLDIYTSYTYHFELHASHDMSKLKAATLIASDRGTKRDAPNGTLLINTRYDVHQTIDDVDWSYAIPGTSSLIPFSSVEHIKFKIHEPGAAYFNEKIKTLIAMNNVSSIGNITFALKPIFVGRTSDNRIDILDKSSPIYFTMTGVDAKFTEIGGVYVIDGIPSSSVLLNVESKDNVMGQQFGRIQSQFVLYGNSTTEMIKCLENRLNKSYEDIIKAGVQNIEYKKIVYTITIDKELHYEIDLNKKSHQFQSKSSKTAVVKEVGKNITTRDNRTINYQYNALGQRKHVEIEPDSKTYTSGLLSELHTKIGTAIVDVLNNIMSLSVGMSNKIKNSNDSIKDGTLQEGLVRYTFTSNLLAENDVMNIIFNVELYKGGTQLLAPNTYNFVPTNTMEFDFYFSTAGKNVDVISFDLHLNNAFITWFSIGNAYGSIYSLNESNEMQRIDKNKYAKDVVTPDKSNTTGPVDNVKTDKQFIPILKNDVIPYPQTQITKSNIIDNVKIKDAPVIKAAQQIAAAQTLTFGPMQEIGLQIRGNIELLDSQIGTVSQKRFATNTGFWVKVNIYDEEGRQFAYRDYYRVMSIHNRFSQGSFIQDMVLLEQAKGYFGKTQATPQTKQNNNWEHNPVPSNKTAAPRGAAVSDYTNRTLRTSKL